VQQLAADFDAYRGRLHDFIKREQLFTGDISHELRTPLAVITGAIELLLADSALDQQNRARAARIGRAVAEMNEMTGALLALAREQDGASPPPPACDAALVIGELVERYRALFHAKPVELLLEVAGAPPIHADRTVLAMVVGNLLRNALSFTSEGQIKVRIEDDAIAVYDSGSGIGDIDTTALFRPYVRGPDSDGAGLGLSLVQRLCERHGWQVTLANLADGGALARLEFVRKGHATPSGEAS
jgi:signal transduction histidine kinase